MASLDTRILCASIAALIAAACNAPAQPAEPAPAEPAAAEQAATAQAPTEPAKPVEAPKPAEPAAKPAGPRPAECDTLCAHTLKLKCGTVEHCLEGCAEMAGHEQCPAEMKAMLGCMAAQPAANFECDTDTKAPAIREGNCDAEQGAVAKCFEPKAPSP